MPPKLEAGKNIAIKVPPHEFEKTVAFYRDVIGLEQRAFDAPNTVESVTFVFGDVNLWIDKIDGMSQAEVWLELRTDDCEAAAKHFDAHGVARRDEIEPLPNDFKGFWIAGPSNIIHLVHE